MEYIRLGNSGLNVSRICLGMMTYGERSERWPWVLGEDVAEEHIRRALDLGINFFDTANMYSFGASEEITGRVLNKLVNRHAVVIASKVYHKMEDHPNGGGLSRKHIMAQVDASLRRLGTDYIDLYQIHRWDYDTPIEETMEALHDCVKAGKVRYIGASSMFAWQFGKALYTADIHNQTRFISMQNHYNLVYREEEREMNRLCVDQNVGLLPWSPLARGIVTGTRTRDGGRNSHRSQNDKFGDSLYVRDEDYDVGDAVAQVAVLKGVTRAQVALAWLLQRPGVAAPIIGATKVEYIDDAAGAVDVTLNDEEVEILEAPYVVQQIRGHS